MKRVRKIQKGPNCLSAIKESLQLSGIDRYQLMVIVHRVFMKGLKLMMSNAKIVFIF